MAFAIARGCAFFNRATPRLSIRSCHSTCKDDEMPSSAYIHIPFCRRRCHYCDFTIVAVGERSRETQSHQDSTMSSYVDLVCKEIQSSNSSNRLKTIFFGGGTPSLLPIHLLRKIFNCLDSKHGIASGAEISMEMDPGTFDAEYLDRAMECGINRISLGVQSFDGGLLKLCGRSHGVNEAYDAIKLLNSRINNWSLDLISSLPHQSFYQWEHSLAEAIASDPAHISIYDLQVEPGTRFGNLYKPGQRPLPNEDDSAEFYKYASKVLREAGYEHYEISNYAKQGNYCRHNLVYWHNLPYYAYGLGATSYVDGRRMSRSKRMKEYAAYVEGIFPDAPLPRESEEERFLDTIMLSLRLAEGINLDKLEGEFGKLYRDGFVEGMQVFLKSGHAVAFGDENDATMNMRLADPDGFLLSTEIISSLFRGLPKEKTALEV